jgi:hypothetical protein
MKSEFEKWFIEQHGKRTMSGLVDKSDEELITIVRDGVVAERVLRCREAWDGQWTSAWYAWNVRDFDKQRSET